MSSSYSSVHKSCTKDMSTGWAPASDSSSDSTSNHHCDKLPINQPLLPTPSVERLLPIGVSGILKLYIFFLILIFKNFYSNEISIEAN